MITTGHANFFSILECGLYRHGEDKVHGLGLKETLSLIEGWVAGKALADTLPWDPRESRTGVSKCYCRDLFKDESTGEYVFVLWKSDADSAGTLWGAQEDAQTGQGKIVEYTNNYRGRRVIWGRPCYYWFVPKFNIVVSIKFDHSVCDSTMMQEWVARAITNKVQHPNKVKDLTAGGQVRFQFKDGDAVEAGRLAFRFNARLKALDTSHAEFQKLAGQVTHVVRRETVRLDAPADERARWLKLFDNIDYLNARPKAKTRQIEVRAEAKPTPDELRKIVETFAKENRKRSDWENIGFETESGTVWVDRYRLHSSLSINQDKPDVLSAEALHRRLAEMRDDLLRPFRLEARAARVVAAAAVD